MEFYSTVTRISRKDTRYAPEAYEFVNEALGYTCVTLDRMGHVSGQELLQGIRKCALDKFGPMAKFVLNNWGVHKCEDFGNIVFNMVESGLLGKTANDSIDDFKEGYEFSEAFEKPFGK